MCTCKPVTPFRCLPARTLPPVAAAHENRFVGAPDVVSGSTRDNPNNTLWGSGGPGGSNGKPGGPAAAGGTLSLTTAANGSGANGAAQAGGIEMRPREAGSANGSSGTGDSFKEEEVKW